MQAPFVKFIEVLVAGHRTPAQVHGRLSDLGLDFPVEGVTKVYEQLYLLYPEHFEDPSGPVDPEWLVDMGIDKMYGYEFQVQAPLGVDGIRGAFNIINDPLMYRLITALALAKINDEDIEMLVNGKYNVEYASEDIVEFLHYFFNVKDWTLQQKKEYIAQVSDPKVKKYYKHALDGDKDYLVWKLGAAPDKSFDDMLRDMASDAYYNFKERAKADPELAQKWGSLAVKIVDRVERLEKATDEKQDLFDSITFKLSVSKKPGDDGQLVGNVRHISDIEST